MEFIKKYSGMIVLLVVALVFAYYVYAQKSMFTSQYEDDMAAKALLEKTVEDVIAARNGSVKTGVSLTDQLKDFLIEEDVSLDAMVIEEEVKQIGELATISYCYTNVGSISADKNLFSTNIKLPGSTKTAVISMDGEIKAGIEVKDLSLTVDETNKVIKIKIPEAKILSHEMDEKSMQVYNESNGLFNKINLEDSSKIRLEIREKAEEKALASNILEQARQNAQLVITNFLMTDPTIKENYTVEFN